MTDTTIYFESIAIHEPVTALTDYIITILCVCFYIRLRKSMTDIVIKNWNLFFLFFGTGTLLSGTSHALFVIHEGFNHDSFWLTGQVFSITSTFFAQKATLHSALKNDPKKKYWNWSYPVQLIIFCIAVFLFHSFSVVIADMAVGLIPVMIFHIRESKNDNWSKYIAYGIVISFLTAFINGAKLSLHAFFNYKDIAHVLIMVSLSVMYVGIKRKPVSSI